MYRKDIILENKLHSCTANETLLIKADTADGEQCLTFTNNKGLYYTLTNMTTGIMTTSIKHNLLLPYQPLDIEAIRYLVEAGVYTTFFKSEVIRDEVLMGERDLSTHDKVLLKQYIDCQVNIYKHNNVNFVSSADVDAVVGLNKPATLYKTFFCELKISEAGELILVMDNKGKTLPKMLIKYIYDPISGFCNNDLLELIVSYEIYLCYGIHSVDGIGFGEYMSLEYINDHRPLNMQSVIMELHDVFTERCAEFIGLSIEEICEKHYGQMSVVNLAQVTNFWLYNRDVFESVRNKFE